MEFKEVIAEIAKLAICYNNDDASEDRTSTDQINAAKSALNTFMARLQAVLGYLDEKGLGQKTLRDMTSVLMSMLIAAVEVDTCWVKIRKRWPHENEEVKVTVNEDERIDVNAVEGLLVLFKSNAGLCQLVEKYSSYIEQRNNDPSGSGHYAYHDRSKEGRKTFANMIVNDEAGVHSALDLDDLLMAAMIFACGCRQLLRGRFLIVFPDGLVQSTGTTPMPQNRATGTMWEQGVSGVPSSLSGPPRPTAFSNLGTHDDNFANPQTQHSKRERKPRVIRD